MAKFSRDKGKRGERLVVQQLKPLFPGAARDLNDVYAERGIDLTNTGNLAVQVKHYKNHVPFSKFKEIVPDENQIPVLVSWPTNRKDEPMVALRLSDFIAILQDITITGVNNGT
jgi:hypothetical protein